MADYYKIRIQHNIPIPKVKPRGKGRGRTPKYPWNEMKIGDSFLFSESNGRSGHSAASQASNELRKFKVVKTDAGYRCWRTK